MLFFRMFLNLLVPSSGLILLSLLLANKGLTVDVMIAPFKVFVVYVTHLEVGYVVGR